MTANKLEKYNLIEKVGDPGEELTFVSKNAVNNMNADINHIDIGYLRLLYKRIKILENGWILCGACEREYTDILDKDLKPLYKVAATLEVQGTGLAYIEKIIDKNVQDNEDIARVFNDCGDDLDDNGVKTVIVSEYNARDTLIGMTEIIRITRSKPDEPKYRKKYHLSTINLFDEYGQEISGIDFSDCVIYNAIPVERPIGIDNIYTVQTYSFETDKVVSYIGVERCEVIRIIGKYSLGCAARSIGETGVFYILNNANRKMDNNDDEEVSEDRKHLSTALVLKFKFDNIDNKINKIDFRRVWFDGIEKVLTVEQDDVQNGVRCSEKFKSVVK